MPLFMRLPAILLGCFIWTLLSAQPVPFSEQKKWGMREGSRILIPARYDTLFAFDKQKNLCLACFKSEQTQSGKFIKVTNVNYACNYLDSTGKALVIRVSGRDTCSVFQLLKQTVKDYTANDSVFKVSCRNKKYLVRKNFRQLTFKPYIDIDLCDDPGFYVAQDLNDADVPMYGLINRREELIIPFQYAGLRLNPSDSLVMVCGTGYGAGAEDFVFDYSGKKKFTYRHHIELATKDYILFKIFEPKEHFIVYELAKKQENGLEADEVLYYKGKEIRMRIRNDWWLYNLENGEKRAWKP